MLRMPSRPDSSEVRQSLSAAAAAAAAAAPEQADVVVAACAAIRLGLAVSQVGAFHRGR